MILRGATSLWGALEGVGLENQDFFGPWNGTYRAIKTTGTLVGLCIRVLLCSVIVWCCELLCVRGVGRSPCSCLVWGGVQWGGGWQAFCTKNTPPPPPQQLFFRTFKKSTAPYKVHNMSLRYIIFVYERGDALYSVRTRQNLQ